MVCSGFGVCSAGRGDTFRVSCVCCDCSITLPLVSPLAHVEKKLHAGEKRPTPVKTAPAPPQQVCGSGDLGPWALWVPAGTPAVPASAGLRQPLPWYPLQALARKAFVVAPLAPVCRECRGCGGCGAAGPVLTVLCLQAAPGPASRLSPSEEAQRRLERIFNTSVIPGALALACHPPGDREVIVPLCLATSPVVPLLGWH